MRFRAKVKQSRQRVHELMCHVLCCSDDVTYYKGTDTVCVPAHPEVLC